MPECCHSHLAVYLLGSLSVTSAPQAPCESPGIQHEPILCDPLTGGSHMFPFASASSFEGYIISVELHVVSGSIVILIFWLLSQCLRT